MKYNALRTFAWLSAVNLALLSGGFLVKGISASSAFVLGVLLATFSGIGVTLFVGQRTRKHLARIEIAALRAVEGDYSTRLDLPGKDEIAQFGATFNELLRRLNSLTRGQRDISQALNHDLKTSVSRARMGLAMAKLSCAENSDAGVKLSAVDKDIDELNHTIDKLSLYLRLDDAASLPLRPSRLETVVDNVISSANARTENKVFRVEPNVSPLPTVAIEPNFMERAVDYLVAHAARRARNTVTLSYGMENGHYYINVDDDGPQSPHTKHGIVTENLSRADDSIPWSLNEDRLGLAVAQRVARWHGGTVRNSAANAAGNRFQLRWRATQTA